MSIIHDALRKAAAEENRTESPHSPPGRFRAQRHSRKALHLVSAGFLLGFFLVVWSAGREIEIFSFSKTKILPSERKDPSAIPGPTLSAPAKPPLDPVAAKKSASGDSEKREEALLLKEGIESYREGKIDRAHQAFTKAVALIPGSAVAHNNLGLTYKQQGKLELAKNHYRKAIELDPKYAEAYNNLGLVYDHGGEIDQAAVYYKKALALQSKVPAFHLNYATFLERKGDFSQARKEYQLYLDLEKGRSEGEAGTPREKESVALVEAHLKELQGF